MAKYVNEIMNAELFSVLPDTLAEAVLADIIRLGITGAPVVDDQGVPVGLVSLRDLAKGTEGRTARDCMTSPAIVIAVSATITEAARVMGEAALHRLVVVDEAGHAVGVVSNIDVVRALIGMPSGHPAAFPHYDESTGLVWTDRADLDLDAVLAHAPDAPGVFVLIHDAPGTPEAVVWAESVENVASRLIDLVSTEQSVAVNRVLAYRNLRFRAAQVPDSGRRDEVLRTLMGSIASWPGA